MPKGDKIIFKATLQRVGDGLGVVFPPELLALLNAKEGHIISMEDRLGVVEVDSEDPELDRQMVVAQQGMSRYRNALRKLAE